MHTQPFYSPLGLCPVLPRWASIRTDLHFTEAETVMPVPHHSVFLQAGCPSCSPTNSVKELKAILPSFWHWKSNKLSTSGDFTPCSPDQGLDPTTGSADCYQTIVYRSHLIHTRHLTLATFLDLPLLLVLIYMKYYRQFGRPWLGLTTGPKKYSIFHDEKSGNPSVWLYMTIQIQHILRCELMHRLVHHWIRLSAYVK